MTESGIETGWMRKCAVVMCLFTTLWGALVAKTGATVTRPAALSIDLGDIPARPVSPEFAFAADNRSIYFLRSDGRVDNVFSMDLNGRSVRQLTHFSESVSRFLVDHQGRFLIIVKDKEGNENYDLYRFDLHSAELLRLTAAGAGDTTMVCGLSPDDRLLYYAQTRDQRREAGLWQIEISTGKLRQLLPGRGRSLGRTVEYFVYDDEGHGFNRFENERLAWQRLVNFLQRHSRSSQGKGVKGPNASRCHHCPVF